MRQLPVPTGRVFIAVPIPPAERRFRDLFKFADTRFVEYPDKPAIGETFDTIGEARVFGVELMAFIRKQKLQTVYHVQVDEIQVAIWRVVGP